MVRRRHVGVVLVLAMGLVACDGGPPEQTFHLDDGTDIEVVTSHLLLGDEVVVDLEVAEESRADHLSLQPVATNTGDEVRSVVDPRGQPEDGVLIAERGFDLPWERGEIEYEVPPSVAATELAPGATVDVGTPVSATPAGANTTLRVCLEVIDGPIARSDDGPSGQEMIRRHDDPVELACSEAVELPSG